MRALVTGASGLIGANLVRALLGRGHSVRAFARATSRLDAIAGLPTEIAHGDVLRPRDVERAARGCDVVFHTAGHFTYGTHDLPTLERTAVDGSLAVLHAAKRARVRRVVLTSSSVVFGYTTARAILDETVPIGADLSEPPYVISKVDQDRLAAACAAEIGIELLLVCPTLSVGPFGTTLGPSNGLIVTYVSDPFHLTYTGGCNVVSAYDVGIGHVLVAERGTAGEHYLLGGENLEWVAMHSLIAELAGVPGPGMIANGTLCLLAATAEEFWARFRDRSPRTTREQARMVDRYYWYNHGKAARLGYAPRSARSALAEAIAWLAASPHVTREMRADMSLAREVYTARREIAAREARFRNAA